jgi:hypothetical protein
MTPTVIVQTGALICGSGVLLMQTIELSADEITFLRALVAIVIGLFFIQVGYAQSLRENAARDPKKQLPPRINGE